MLYYATTIGRPKYASIAPSGWEAAHALESLVVSGVRFAVRLRPDANLPVDGALSCRNNYPEGTAERHQYRARPGFGARLLRPAPGLLPQPRPGSEHAHPYLERSSLPRSPRHPTSQRPARPRR